MKHDVKQIALMFFLILSVGLFFTACSNSDNDSRNSNEGVLRLSLTDAFSVGYKACYVTIKEIKVLPQGSSCCDWFVVAAPNKTYNLLELVNGILEDLGSTTLPAGTYSEMRIVLGDTQDDSINILGGVHPYANYIIDAYDNIYELTLPEDYEDGYSVAYEFTVNADSATDLILDFNVTESIVQQGSDGNWILSPVISILDEDQLSQFGGFITDSVSGSVLQGAMVNAQQISSDGSTQDVVASTVSDETGGYTLMLNPGTYTIVAQLDGYIVSYSEVTIEPCVFSTLDFPLILEPGGEGTITGSVIIDEGKVSQFISVSVLESIGDTVVQVASLNVANGGQYTFDLPPGTYSLKAIFYVNCNEMTFETGDSFVVTDGGVIEFDIIFSSVADEVDCNCSCDKDGHHERHRHRHHERGGHHECEKPEKVTVCHKGRDVHVSKSQLKAHVRHGGSDAGCTSGGEPINNSGDDDSEHNENKVKICHKGRNMSITKTALKMHMERGDKQGECSCN